MGRSGMVVCRADILSHKNFTQWNVHLKALLETRNIFFLFTSTVGEVKEKRFFSSEAMKFKCSHITVPSLHHHHVVA